MTRRRRSGLANAAFSMAVDPRATRHLLAAWAAVASVACFVNITDLDRSLDVEVSEPFSYQLDATATVRLRLEGINGVVTVLGDPGSNAARVTGERRVRSDTRADAQQFLDRVTVTVLEQGDEIVVQTIQPSSSGGREVIVDYDLIIPAGLDVDLANVNGAVTVRDLVGDVEVTLVNGDIAGDVTLLPSGTVDLTVVNGTVMLDVPTSVSAMVEADVVNGSISVVGLTLLDATTSPRSVRGRLGAGDGLIDLNSTNGTITLRGS
ncbi:MAG: DUF4097 domain-containing protein [Gemmatimonadota bacterium]|nr:DUF4097 domain-containing protein [Gemmatimonadota bacterium]